MTRPVLPPICTAIVVLLAGFVVSVPTSGAFSLTARTDGCWDVSFDPARLHTIRSADGDRFEYSAAFDRVAAGEPILPEVQVRLDLPRFMRAVSVHVLAADTQLLDGEYRVAPGQPPRPITSGALQPVASPDGQIYGSTDAYPASPVELIGMTDRAGVPIAVVSIRPVEYRPALGAARLYTRLVFHLELAPGHAADDSYTQDRSDSRLDPAQVDYVIITSPSVAADWNTLAEWRTRSGLAARIVATDWIWTASGYEGSSVEKIRAFIEDAATTWSTRYILLGGDTNTIPCHWRSTSLDPHSIPNDTYYADFDGDWTVDVALGRAPVRGSLQVSDFCAKLLSYEQQPPIGDFTRSALLLGFDLDITTDGEVCQEAIAGSSLPNDWTIDRVYDSHAGNHKEAALAAFNAGRNLVNHIDHARCDELGLGSYRHDLKLATYEVPSLSNGGRPSVLYSLGCYAANFDLYTCIAEDLVRQSAGGALAFLGNSRYGWYNPGSTSTLSFRYDREFCSAFFAPDGGRLGDVFSEHKNRVFPTDEVHRYIFTELTLLGDPAQTIWTREPLPLTVAHPTRAPLGSSEFSIRVVACGYPLADARVCVWKADEVYERAVTDANGVARMSIAPASEGPLAVTVTGPDAAPYLGEAQVREGSIAVREDRNSPASDFRVLQNPLCGRATLRFALVAPGRVTLRVFDMTGREVRRLLSAAIRPAGVHSVEWDGCDARGHRLTSGLYICSLDIDGAGKSVRVCLTR